MNQIDITENVARFESERDIAENYESGGRPHATGWIIRWDFDKSERYFENPIGEWLKDNNVNVKISHTRLWKNVHLNPWIRILIDFESATDMIHFKLRWL